MSPAVNNCLPALAEHYLQAWNRHDLDAIVACHTADSVYTSVATGKAVRGHQAVREAIAQVFTVWPDLHFEPERIHVTDEVIVAQSIIQVTQAVALPLRDMVIEPNGRTVRCAIADILALENGLVARKDTYLDVLDYIHQMQVAQR